MSRPAILDRLWHYRKLLLLEVLLLGLLELLYLFPTGLGWWVLTIIALVILLCWWINNGHFNRITWLFAGELTWVILGGIGFLSFSLLHLWQMQLVIMVIVALSALLAYWHQNHIDYRQWSLAAVNWLALVDLLALFITTVSLLLAVQFYSLGIFWLMLGVGLQLILALYLLFWRHGLFNKRFWLYALVLALVGEQLVWITHAWHKNLYFKAFLLLVIYYLYSNFVMHYIQGNLTIKVVFEYIGIAIFLILMLFLFDLLFLLIPNI